MTIRASLRISRRLRRLGGACDSQASTRPLRNPSAPILQRCASTDPAPPLSSHDLRRLALAAAIPMVGFGFADNFVMIVAGDYIDNLPIWRTLALSTLAAAGIGNLVSDLVGVGLGNAIEDLALRYGIQSPSLSSRQLALPMARFSRTVGTVVGISLGCLLGMTPLFFSERDSDVIALSRLSKEELELYNECFRDFTVAPEQFARLLRIGSWHTAKPGEAIVPTGSYLSHVIMLHKGEAAAYPADVVEEGGDLKLLEPAYTYTPKYDNGSNVIGASRIVDGSCRSRTYPNEVIASYNSDRVRYIKWDYGELDKLMQQDPAIKAAVLSSLCHDLFVGDRQMEDDGRLLLSREPHPDGEEYRKKNKAVSSAPDPGNASTAQLLKSQVVMNARLLEEVVRLKREARTLQKEIERQHSSSWGLVWVKGDAGDDDDDISQVTDLKPGGTD